MHERDDRLRLSLAGVQNKAVLLRDEAGVFGKPLDGMPSTHILKPEPPDGDYAGLATNEYFCMRLAARCGLVAADVELVVLAGYDRILCDEFFARLGEVPVINIHPALLPAFGGLNGAKVHDAVLAAGVGESGCTVHLAHAGHVDAGEILVQRRVPVRPDDDAETLAARVLEQEHLAMVEAIARFSAKDVFAGHW